MSYRTVTVKYEYDETIYDVEVEVSLNRGIDSQYTSYGWTPPEYPHLEIEAIWIHNIDDELAYEISNKFEESFPNSKDYEKLLQSMLED